MNYVDNAPGTKHIHNMDYDRKIQLVKENIHKVSYDELVELFDKKDKKPTNKKPQ